VLSSSVDEGQHPLIVALCVCVSKTLTEQSRKDRKLTVLST
jgi:hypothetical protein